jgi:hypothetical protein
MKRPEKTMFYRNFLNDILTWWEEGRIFQEKFREIATASEFKNSGVQL